VPSERLTEFSNGDLVFDVLDSGPIDGTPVVLLHGFPQRASSWHDVSAHLHSKGARTFAPDQRGCSPRARPRSRFAYRAPQLVGDINALVTAIGQPVHLVGHDWGSAVSWAVAAKHPESIASLTAVSIPHPMAYTRSLARSNQLLKSYYILLFQLPWLPERWLSSRIVDRFLRGSGMTPQMIESYHNDYVKHGALRGCISYYRSIPATNPRDMPDKVRVPTAFVWSDGDQFINRTAAVGSARYVDADYVFEQMPGMSHWIPEQRPAELAEIIARRAGLEAA